MRNSARGLAAAVRTQRAQQREAIWEKGLVPAAWQSLGLRLLFEVTHKPTERLPGLGLGADRLGGSGSWRSPRLRPAGVIPSFAGAGGPRAATGAVGWAGSYVGLRGRSWEVRCVSSPWDPGRPGSKVGSGARGTGPTFQSPVRRAEARSAPDAGRGASGQAPVSATSGRRVFVSEPGAAIASSAPGCCGAGRSVAAGRGRTLPRGKSAAPSRRWQTP